MPPPLPDEHRARRQRAAAELKPRKLDALLISAISNVRYLAGFTGSNAALLLSAGDAILFTDPRYEIQAARETSCRVRVLRGPLLTGVMQSIKRQRLRRLGFERNRISFADHDYLRDKLPLGVSLEPVTGLIEQQRMVKSAAEQALIRDSVATNSHAFRAALKRFRPGMPESALAAEIDYQMRSLGAEGPAFETIVAAGERSALPHARPTSNPIANNQLLLVDMGASREGYASDMTRTVSVGRANGTLKRVYGAVLDAQLAAIDAVREGASAGHVDRVARNVLRRRGLDKQFVHSTGHGLGLEIHEPPRLGRREKTRLLAGMVVTIEPGAYLEGLGGVRIEDTVLVTRSGCEVLTPTAKEWMTL